MEQTSTLRAWLGRGPAIGHPGERADRAAAQQGTQGVTGPDRISTGSCNHVAQSRNLPCLPVGPASDQEGYLLPATGAAKHLNMARNLALPISLAACLICLPLMSHLNSFGDEGIPLNAADHLTGGERLYVDFFEFLPPGSFLIVQAWFHLVGSSITAMRGLAMLTVSAIAVLIYLCCREVLHQGVHRTSRSNMVSVMTALFWLAASPPIWLMEISHHWFTTLFSMMAALMALRGCCTTRPGFPSPHLLCGLAIGAATMVTPTQGVLTLLATTASLIGPGGIRRFAWLAAGCAAVPLLTLAYILYQGSFAAAVADILIFSATRYASIQALPYGDGGGLLHPLVLIHPLNFLLLAGVCWQDWRGCRHDRVLRTAAAFALAALVAAFPRPDLVHLGFTLPLALPLTAYCAIRLARTAAPTVTLVCTAAAIFLICQAALPLIELLARDRTHILTARGEAMFPFPDPAALVTRLAAEPASERVFFYPYMPMVPYLTGRRQVSRYDVFVPYFTTDLQYQEACTQMLQQASLVVVDWRWADTAFLHQVFPAMPDGNTPAKDALEAVLRSGFAPVWHAGSFEILRRIPEAARPGPACTGGT